MTFIRSELHPFKVTITNTTHLENNSEFHIKFVAHLKNELKQISIEREQEKKFTLVAIIGTVYINNKIIMPT